MSLLLITWIPVGCSGATETNGVMSPDFPNSLTAELSLIEIRMSLPEHGVSMSDLSFTKFRPEIQEFASGEQHISKSFGILTSGKLSTKSHDADLKVLKTYTTDLPVVDRIVSLDDNSNFLKDMSDMLPPCSAAVAKMISARVDSMADCIFSC
jgi:hypothetical protein